MFYEQMNATTREIELCLEADLDADRLVWASQLHMPS